MIPLADRPRSHADVSIPADGVQLGGEMHIPAGTTGIVAFAHGSGSSRHSPRNQFVARELQKAGLATLLMDLLEEDEAEDRDKVFDIELLALAPARAARWLGEQPGNPLPALGYFGASTGAAAALVAAARKPAGSRRSCPGAAAPTWPCPGCPR